MKNTKQTRNTYYRQRRRTELRQKIYKNLVVILPIIIGIVTIASSVVVCKITKTSVSPYFVISTEYDDNLNIVTVVKNDRGVVSDVHCKWISFIEIKYTEGRKKNNIWTCIDSDADVGKFNYDTHKIVLTQPMIESSMEFMSFLSPLLKFSLDESLYKNWKESIGEAYKIRELSYEKIRHCIVVEYKDELRKEKCEYFELTSNDYKLLNNKNVPNPEPSMMFSQHKNNPMDYCSAIFDKFGIAYKIEDNNFMFIYDYGNNNYINK